jgi:hypothetical protein
MQDLLRMHKYTKERNLIVNWKDKDFENDE